MNGTMNLMCPALAIVLALSQIGVAEAQAPTNGGQDPSQAATPVDRIVVRDGTDVKLRFLEPLSSKTAHVGDPVTLELAEDLRVNDMVVVREGAKAAGEITTAKKAGMLGKPGDLAMQLFYLKAGDSKIKLRGTKGKEGESKVSTAIVLTVLVGVFGLMKHGKNAEIPAGTSITAYVADDTPVAMATPAATDPPGGQLSLTSDPVGGEVQIDGKFVGNTPSVLALTPGDHSIKISVGAKAWEKMISVTAGSKLVVNAVLAENKP